MQSLPEGFRELYGGELVVAKDLWREMVDALEVGGPGLSKLPLTQKRIAYQDVFGADHIRALAAAATMIGDDKCLIVGDVVSGIAALEVTWDAYLAYADRPAGAPRDIESDGARALIDQSIPGHLVCCSPRGAWGFLDTYFLDHGDMAGSPDFMRTYRESNPDVIFDPLRWMHGDGNYLLVEWKSVPRAPGLRGRFTRRERVAHYSFDRFVRRYLEDFYGEEAASWLHELFLATNEWSEVEQGVGEAWEPFDARLTSALREQEGVEDKLRHIWDSAQPVN